MNGNALGLIETMGLVGLITAIDAMLKAIDVYARMLAARNAVGLFYFAGHGIQVNGTNYLVPLGVKIEKEADVEYETVDAGRVLSEFANARNALSIVILDACRDNPFASRWQSSPGYKSTNISRGLARFEAPKPVVKPQWNARLGLGATFEGTFGTKESASRGYGILGQLRYRTGRHLALELQGGWERSTTNSGATRTDVPFTFGLLVPFLGPEHAFSPYFVAAGGVNFADLNLVDSDAFKLDDKRAQLLGQLGGGVELRLGHRFAINADLRVEGRWNMHGPSDDVAQSTVKIDGNQILPLANSVGVRLGAGATVYF